jgi:hypothetical protein
MARSKASHPIDLLMKKGKKQAQRNLYLSSFKHWVGGDRLLVHPSPRSPFSVRRTSASAMTNSSDECDTSPMAPLCRIWIPPTGIHKRWKVGNHLSFSMLFLQCKTKWSLVEGLSQGRHFAGARTMVENGHSSEFKCGSRRAVRRQHLPELQLRWQLCLGSMKKPVMVMVVAVRCFQV